MINVSSVYNFKEMSSSALLEVFSPAHASADEESASRFDRV